MAPKRRTLERARRYADGGVTVDDPLAGMSPVDLARLRAELAAKPRELTVDERWRNYATTGADVAGSLPVIGNAMSAYDAYQGGKGAVDAAQAGDVRGAALNTAAAVFSALGAVSGIPWSRTAGEVARDARSTARIFAGPKAKTANLKALTRAEKMRAKGVDRDEIYRKTGWFWGADGQPRFEISDAGARLEGERLTHPGYETAYGAPPTIYSQFDLDTLGRYQPGTDSHNPYIAIRTGAEAGGTHLHELQHHIQALEGTATGGSKYGAFGSNTNEGAWPIYRERIKTLTNPLSIEDYARQSGFDNIEQARSSYADYAKSVNKMSRNVPAHLDRAAQEYAADEWYKRLAGEVEARNVQTRRNWTDERRRDMAPWRTQDIPDERQIVRRTVGGQDAFPVYHGTPHTVDRFRMDRIGTGEGRAGGPAAGHGRSTQPRGAAFHARMKKYADGGGVTDPLAGMSPVDLAKLRAELAAKPRELTVDERWRNYGTTGADVAGALPVIGNIMSAYDTYHSGQDTARAMQAGDVRGAALGATATGLGALGTVTGLPWGRGAARAAREGASTARIFAGPSAKTANTVALARAEEMRAAGAAPDEIFHATGWFWGADGKPRFEIDDSKAAFDVEALGPEARPLSDVLHHPELYEAYPDAAKIRVKSATGEQLGVGIDGDYAEGWRSQYFPESSIPGVIRIRNSRPVTGQRGMLPTTLHEVQHDIQALEGFPKGSSGRSAYDPRPKAEREALRERMLAEAQAARAEDFVARQDGDRARSDAAEQRAINLEWQADQMKQRGWGAYFREAGEVEARNVEMRRELTAAQRLAAYPTTTQDIMPEAVWYKPGTDYADGGEIPARKGKTSRDKVVARARMVNGGAIRGNTAGRGDAHAVDVPEGSYVIPADVVAALGEGNTEAGMHQLDAIHGGYGDGRGVSGRVPIMISDGEFLLSPQAVTNMGGADAIDRWVVQTRQQYARQLMELPAPRT